MMRLNSRAGLQIGTYTPTNISRCRARRSVSLLATPNNPLVSTRNNSSSFLNPSYRNQIFKPSRYLHTSSQTRIWPIAPVVKAWKSAGKSTRNKSVRLRAPMSVPSVGVLANVYRRGKGVLKTGGNRVMMSESLKRARMTWKEQSRLIEHEAGVKRAALARQRKEGKSAGGAGAMEGKVGGSATKKVMRPATHPVSAARKERAKAVSGPRGTPSTTANEPTKVASSASKLTATPSKTEPPRSARLARRRISSRKPGITIRQMSPKTGLPDGESITEATPALKAKVLSSKRQWTPQSRRVGLIALKKGMSVVWDEMGIRVPVTVLQVEENQVLTNILTQRRPGRPPYRAVQVGAKNVPPQKTHIGMRGHFRRAGVQCKQFVKEFEVSEDAHLPPGMKLSAIHFVPGQYVDVQATTMGKGFQGVMKRWGFSGGTASHGNSLAHRTPGSTGQHQDPGRVWPGKKMPGRMGGKTRTMQNLYVMRVDTSLNLIFVKGNVPGPDDGRTPVYITDAIKRVQSEALRKQLKTGGDGDWVTVDANGKLLAPTKGTKDVVKGEDENTLGIGRGITGLPFPAGTVGMAKLYPPILVAPSTRVTSPWGAGEGA